MWGSRGVRIGALAIFLAGCASATRSQDEGERVSSRRFALTSETRAFQFNLPVGSDPSQWLGSASVSLQISDRVQLLGAGSGHGAIASSGTSASSVGTDANTGTIISNSALTVRDRSTVHGDALSNSTLTFGVGTSATGTAKGAAGVNFQPFSWKITFPASGGNVTVPNGAVVSVNPGSAGIVTVNSSGTLKLSSGTYYFDELSLQPQATLAVNTTSGPVFLWVRNTLAFRGATSYTGPNDRLLIGYAGTASPAFDKSPDATVVAPLADVRLGVGGSPYTGAFFAKSLTLDPAVTFTQRAFSGWSALPFSVVPRFECVETRAHSKVAIFGYTNPRSTSVTLPIGADNRFLPGPSDRLQLSTFLPGDQSGAVAVSWINFKPSWSLNGLTADVDLTKACPLSYNVIATSDATVKLGAPLRNRILFFRWDRDSIRWSVSTARLCVSLSARTDLSRQRDSS
jgi:hypothetical protein